MQKREGRSLDLICVLGILTFAFAGAIYCNTSASENADTVDRVLDAVTKVAAPTQERVVDTCNALEEQAAVLPDLVQAEAQVAAIRTRCDAALATFTALRHAQAAARGAADRVRAGTITLEQAVVLALEVRRAHEAAKAAAAGLGVQP